MPEAGGAGSQNKTVSATSFMRTVISILALATLTVVAGCAHIREDPSFWQDKTILLSDRTIPELNGLANDSGASEANRAQAVFSVFAGHLRPGCTSAEFRDVLSNTNWLRDCRLQGVYLLGRWIPVDMASGDTVFVLTLFPAPPEKGASLWFIYFRLTGSLREDGARAFLAGDAPVESKTRMVEFALS